MFHGIPIIGIAGGIGSGKSFVAALFGELGCAVIDADAQVREAYDDPAVRQTLREWWGDSVFHADGSVNRSAIAKRIFNDEDQRRRLSELVHPMVNQGRVRWMQKRASENPPVAFILDTPLLFEAGMNGECDAVVFVDAPGELRLERVRRSRGWDEAELLSRQNLQWPLDRKREMSDYVIENAADAGITRSQVRAVLSQILERTSGSPSFR
jgi:dephospho-CoA kinase